MLSQIPIPSNVDAREIPQQVRELIVRDQHRIQVFQDQWNRPQIEQFVAADFFHVHQSLDWILETQLTIGKRFLEWGCGFAVVTAIASSLQLDAIGIEAESELIKHGHETLRQWDQGGELVEGNFLPKGSEQLADDPWLPSIGHNAAPAYEALGFGLDDFAIVYSYPWPGEDEFHQQVFDKHAANGALLLMFCGPNDLRLFRRTSHR